MASTINAAACVGAVFASLYWVCFVSLVGGGDFSLFVILKVVVVGDPQCKLQDAIFAALVPFPR